MHAAIPVTIIADMVAGVAYLIFLGFKQQLTEEVFWEITHKQLFEYPYQQIVYVLFASIKALVAIHYHQAYDTAQWGVLNLSYLTYGGSSRIFGNVYAQCEIVQLFQNITLNAEDSQNLNNFIHHITLLKNSQSSLKDIRPLYRIFYEKKPGSIGDLEDKYTEKSKLYPSCADKDALEDAKRSLEAYFALPLVLRGRLEGLSLR